MSVALGTPKGACAEKVWVEADRRYPARDKPSILPRGHAAAAITTAGEKKLARLLAIGFDVIIDGLPRLLRQLKPDRPTGFLLPHRRDRLHNRSGQRPRPEDIFNPIAPYFSNPITTTNPSLLPSFTFTQPSSVLLDPVLMTVASDPSAQTVVFANITLVTYTNNNTPGSVMMGKDLGNPTNSASSICGGAQIPQASGPAPVPDPAPNALCGNPVNAATGNKFQTETDFTGAPV